MKINRDIEEWSLQVYSDYDLYEIIIFFLIQVLFDCKELQESDSDVFKSTIFMSKKDKRSFLKEKERERDVLIKTIEDLSKKKVFIMYSSDNVLVVLKKQC